MSEPSTSQPENGEVHAKPLDVDGVNAAIAGTIAFAIGAVVLFLLKNTLAEHDATWFIWTAVAGCLGGVGGIAYATRRRAAYRAAGKATH